MDDISKTPELTHSPDGSSSDLKRSKSQRYSQVSFVRSVPLGLSHSSSLRSLPSPASSPTQPKAQGFNRRASTKRSDSLPSFPRIDEPVAQKDPLRGRVDDLPANPKTWSPSQVALFLAHILKLAPPRMREDLLSLISKNSLTGRRFLALTEAECREKLGFNPAWTKVFLDAKASLRMECLRARILGEADFEEGKAETLGVPLDPNAGRNSWKRSWRRSQGSKSKGRVKVRRCQALSMPSRRRRSGHDASL